MAFVNNKESVFGLVHELESAGCPIILFGGWAAELLKVKKPWAHKDVDLLLLDNDFKKLASYIQSNDWPICKSYRHKKAFMLGRVMVEVFLVRQGKNGYETMFVGEKGNFTFQWPNLLYSTKGGHKIATNKALQQYEKTHETIHANGPWK